MKKLLLLLLIRIASRFTFAQHATTYSFWLGAQVSTVIWVISEVEKNPETLLYNLEMKDTRWATGPFINRRFHPMCALQGGITTYGSYAEKIAGQNGAPAKDAISISETIF
ncbi:MAG: hypothetical protein IPM74_19810 [Crocinitomicaceae bacterium]|nr:hypothetical protein [Crocinitomicaceae bacterium]